MIFDKHVTAKKKTLPKKKVARFRSKSVQSINRNGFEVIWGLTAHHIVKTHNPLELFSQPALDRKANQSVSKIALYTFVIFAEI